MVRPRFRKVDDANAVRRDRSGRHDPGVRVGGVLACDHAGLEETAGITAELAEAPQLLGSRDVLGDPLGQIRQLNFRTDAEADGSREV